VRASSINFADPRILALRPLRTWTASFLVLGALLFGYACTRLIEIERATSDAEEALTAAKTPPASQRAVTPAAGSGVTAVQILAANVAIQHMNVPWHDLLDAIEQATPPEIAIVALNPDPAQGELVGEAEAKDLESMSNYIDRLQKAPMFDGVALVKHEVNAQDANHPIRFQFQARWAKTMRGAL
jgi:hypothetical protein